MDLEGNIFDLNGNFVATMDDGESGANDQGQDQN